MLISKVAELTDRCERQAERIKELLEFNAPIKDKLEDERKRPGLINTKHVGENKKCCYTTEMRSCVYKLLSYQVSFENVGPVSKTVLSMIGVEADHLPSDRTVARGGLTTGPLGPGPQSSRGPPHSQQTKCIGHNH